MRNRLRVVVIGSLTLIPACAEYEVAAPEGRNAAVGAAGSTTKAEPPLVGGAGGNSALTPHTATDGGSSAGAQKALGGASQSRDSTAGATTGRAAGTAGTGASTGRAAGTAGSGASTGGAFGTAGTGASTGGAAGTAGAGAVEPAAVVVYYPFSGNADDLGPRGLDGNPVGSVSLTTDRKGTANSAYLLNGGYISICDTTATGAKGSNNCATIGALKAFTLSAWISPENPSSGYIIAKVNVGRDFVFELKDAGSLSAHFAASSDKYMFVNASEGPPVQKNTWTFVAAAWTGTTWLLYNNGRLVGERVVTDGSSPAWAGTVLSIGSLESNANYQGKIDEVRIHDRALSGEQINWLMKQ